MTVFVIADQRPAKVDVVAVHFTDDVARHAPRFIFERGHDLHIPGLMQRIQGLDMPRRDEDGLRTGNCSERRIECELHVRTMPNYPTMIGGLTPGPLFRKPQHLVPVVNGGRDVGYGKDRFGVGDEGLL